MWNIQWSIPLPKMAMPPPSSWQCRLCKMGGYRTNTIPISIHWYSLFAHQPQLFVSKQNKEVAIKKKDISLIFVPLGHPLKDQRQAVALHLDDETIAIFALVPLKNSPSEMNKKMTGHLEQQPRRRACPKNWELPITCNLYMSFYVHTKYTKGDCVYRKLAIHSQVKLKLPSWECILLE